MTSKYALVPFVYLLLVSALCPPYLLALAGQWQQRHLRCNATLAYVSSAISDAASTGFLNFIHVGFSFA